jgi:hypothetical protein
MKKSYLEQEADYKRQKQFSNGYRDDYGWPEPTKPKPYQKPYDKNKPYEEHYKSPSETPMSPAQLERLFWEVLVHLNWRKYKAEVSDTSKLKDSYQLMLVCPDCNKIIDTQQSHTVTLIKVKNMSSSLQIEERIKRHKASSQECTATEYNENGEAISEVALEAIVEAK